MQASPILTPGALGLARLHPTKRDAAIMAAEPAVWHGSLVLRSALYLVGRLASPIALEPHAGDVVRVPAARCLLEFREQSMVVDLSLGPVLKIF